MNNAELHKELRRAGDSARSLLTEALERAERAERQARELNDDLDDLAKISDEQRKALKSSLRGGHLPFCPGSLPDHRCWPECSTVRAALDK